MITLEKQDGQTVKLEIGDAVKVNGKQYYIDDLQISEYDFAIQGEKL